MLKEAYVMTVEIMTIKNTPPIMALMPRLFFKISGHHQF